MYDYNMLQQEIEVLKKCYPFISVYTIGHSIKKQNIYIIRLGTGKRKVFYNAAHHALESITSRIMMKFIFDYADAYIHDTRIKGHNIRKLFKEVSIYIAPMVNPDGIEIAKTDNTWQANARGVDLNHNYDALWHEGVEEISKIGITTPGPTKYSGAYPESEPETKAIANFTRAHKFEYVLAFHSQGEVIYWKYGNSIPLNASAIAKILSELSGYILDETEGAASYSGYKDWFIKEFNRPGFTIEVGLGKNPLPSSQFKKIYNDILEILIPISV